MADKLHSRVMPLKAARTHKRIVGTPDRPRVRVYKSRRQIYAQVVDDLAGIVLLGVSTLTEAIPDGKRGKKNKDTGRELGKLLATRCKEKGIDKIRFDRSGYIYHGKIAALADAAREGGLQF